MPRKPKKPCAFPGCPELVEGRYCEKHQKEMDRKYEKYGRDPEARKRYSGSWKKIRARYAHQHPLCEMCLKEGRAVKMEHVHHIIPLSEGGTHDEGNLMSVCMSCHSRIHAERGDRWHRR